MAVEVVIEIIVPSVNRRRVLMISGAKCFQNKSREHHSMGGEALNELIKLTLNKHVLYNSISNENF